MKKKIVVNDCLSCPLCSQCEAWKALSKKERFVLACGVGVPSFILNNCPLPDDEA